MLSVSLRAFSKARPYTSITKLLLLSKAACPPLSHRCYASELGLRRHLQRRDYAAPHDKTSGLEHETKQLLRQSELNETTEARDKRQTRNDTYTTPKKGFISYLPPSWIPYAELARLDRPTGTMYLFWPCVFSTTLAGSMIEPIVTIEQWSVTVALFLAGAFVMRGAGCTVNDLWDRNLDPHVQRTRFRPIARGAVTPMQASIFLGAQLLAGLSILLQFPTSCLYYGVPSLLLVGTYPLAKRVTNYPQVVLGLTFSWGAIMGFPAMGMDLFSNNNALYAVAALYASCIAWTVNYDMVYAHMDITDDAKAGIKSIALTHKHNTMAVLHGLAAAQAALFAASCSIAGVPWYYTISEGIVLYFALDMMRRRLDLKSVKSCLWYFNNCATVVGICVSCCMLLNLFAQDAEHSEPKRSLHQASAVSNMQSGNADLPA